jgi:hypothetical protein
MSETSSNRVKRLLAALAVVALATTVTHPALAGHGGKSGSNSNAGSNSVSNNRNSNKNVNINTNINTNTATATAIANVKVDVNTSSGGNSAPGGAGVGSFPTPSVVPTGYPEFTGAQASGSGGSGCCSDTSSPATTGWLPNSLDLGHEIKSRDLTDVKWDYALSCRDEIGEPMFIQVSEQGDGNMSVTATDGGGITWDRFEMYGGTEAHPFKIKKVSNDLGDNWQWHGIRNGTPGVSMTGTLHRTKGHENVPDKWAYVEIQNVGGGSRTFTTATCSDHQTISARD